MTSILAEQERLRLALRSDGCREFNTMGHVDCYPDANPTLPSAEVFRRLREMPIKQATKCFAQLQSLAIDGAGLFRAGTLGLRAFYGAGRLGSSRALLRAMATGTGAQVAAARSARLFRMEAAADVFDLIGPPTTASDVSIVAVSTIWEAVVMQDFSAVSLASSATSASSALDAGVYVFNNCGS